MQPHGFFANVADLFEEMANAFGQPEFTQGLQYGELEITPTRLEDLAPLFAQSYQRL